MGKVTTAAELTAEQRGAYVRALRRSRTAGPALKIGLEERRAAAWEAARAAAALLRERYGATRVVVFGSLARGDFTLGSDIDLAAWDVAPQRYFEAVSFLLDLGADMGGAAGGFRIDVVAPEVAPAPLRREIEREGVAI
jgi:predicted nucleotidyltransferase